MTLPVTPGTGATMLTDDIAGVKSAVAKLQIGAAGVDGGLISPTNGLPSNIAQVGGSALALGQALAAASIPVVLTAAQIASLTAPVVAAPIPTIATSSAYAHTAVTTAYAFGQLWANNATAGSVTFGTVTVAKANNQAFTIMGGLLKKSGIILTNAIFRIHLFNAAPTTAVADYGTYSGNLTYASNYVGSLDCTIDEAGSDTSWGTCIVKNSAILCNTPVSGAQTLYWVPEVRAAYTPVSAETLTLQLFIQ